MSTRSGYACLNLPRMKVRYQRCSGSRLFTENGNIILDFLSGYCVYNTGHNHPAIMEAIKHDLDRGCSAMLQSHVPDLADRLAHLLCTIAGGGLEKAIVACSGSEGVEAGQFILNGREIEEILVYQFAEFLVLLARRASSDRQNALHIGVEPAFAQDALPHHPGCAEQHNLHLLIRP